MLGRRRELQILGRDVDESAIRITHIIPAGRAVIVKISTDPALGVDQTLERAFKHELLARLDSDLLFKMRVLRSAHDNDAILARRKLLREVPVLAHVLVHATMRTPLRAEIEFRCVLVERGKVSFAGNGFAGFVGNVEADNRGGPQCDRCGLVGSFTDR